MSIRLIGQWHYHTQAGTITFFTIPFLNQNGKVLVTKQHQQCSATYRIYFTDNYTANLSIVGLPEVFEATIKVLTGNTLILRRNRNLDILQRKIDISFVNKPIDNL